MTFDSPKYVDSINGWPKATRDFWRSSYTDAKTGEKRQKSENWTTCGLWHLDPGTVFLDPDDGPGQLGERRHFVVIWSNVFYADMRTETIVSVEVADATTGKRMHLRKNANNTSVLTRCDVYYDTGAEE